MRNLLLLATFTVLAGCNSSKTLFEEHQSIGEDMVWQPSEPITFTIDVSENKHDYELAVAVRYANGFPYNKLPIFITETNPNGESVRKDIELIIQPTPGEYLGEKGFDIIDLEQVIDAQKEFPTFGKYTYTLIPDTDDPAGFPLMMEVGLILRDTQKK